MIIFKNYFQIVKSYLPLIVTYVVIFLAIAYFATSSSTASTSYTDAKPKVLLINNDQNTTLTKNFEKYLKKVSDIVDLKVEEEKIKDALFFGKVSYVITIPENFTNDFIALKNPKLETEQAPDSYSATYTELLLNKYFKTVSIYTEMGHDLDEATSLAMSDLEKVTSVHGIEKSDLVNAEKVVYYYNFVSYILLALIIVIVGMVMKSYNTESVRKRNLVSPISYRSQNRQILLGHFTFTVLIWLSFAVMSIVLYGGIMFSPQGLLVMLNSFIAVMVFLSIAFLIGTLIHNEEALSSISNVLALGSSFLAGAFVPQEFLGSFTLGIARFLPNYWYIKNTNEIFAMTTIGTKELTQIFTTMGILFLFGVFFFILTNIISKRKRQIA